MSIVYLLLTIIFSRFFQADKVGNEGVPQMFHSPYGVGLKPQNVKYSVDVYHGA